MSANKTIFRRRIKLKNWEWIPGTIVTAGGLTWAFSPQGWLKGIIMFAFLFFVCTMIGDYQDHLD
ncbi:MAG: hypothetical protein A2722_01585 [Candidatus Doudnabacteria bacterium RIFCSPHIGHO2_01_FULL_50_11]|uniref:Uncharacterized protein n=1 Tax=Candidatus Doudnabacteria bacterium RIFCSPHIGHO2_01_FULL_50_11 TaxID=1817828 RepID=A0A1F5PE99_9BACT|nr:MAG: hypothetical protein A2722_01585 [Candidatus Doudnabacteria bacterium RIFCSPHIGHO2_01_FULL_50_11]HLC44300.1 hypothetical protein [Patescibacteria group bacterium]